MGFKMYGSSRRYLSDAERKAGEEITRRQDAVKLAEEYMRRHLRYGDNQAVAQLMADEVLRLGLVKEEATTEALNKILAELERKMAAARTPLPESQQFTECFATLRKTYPYIELNTEAVVVGILHEYRGEYPYDDELDPDRLVRLLGLPKLQPFISANDKWHEERQQQAARNASVADSARMILEMTAEYYVDGEIKGKTPLDKQRIQKQCDADTAFLNSLSPEELNARYVGWKEIERQKSLSPAELKAEVRASESRRLASAGYSRFAPMPEVYEETGEPWTTKLLNRLGNEGKLRDIVRRYGADAINKITRANSVSGRQ